MSRPYCEPDITAGRIILHSGVRLDRPAAETVIQIKSALLEAGENPSFSSSKEQIFDDAKQLIAAMTAMGWLSNGDEACQSIGPKP